MEGLFHSNFNEIQVFNSSSFYFVWYDIFIESEAAHDQEFEVHFQELPIPCFWFVFPCHEDVLLSSDRFASPLVDLKHDEGWNQHPYNYDHWKNEKQRPLDVFACVAIK